MIRSSLAGSSPTPVAPSYPKLAQARVSGTVWLVTGPKTGVVVHAGPRAKDAKVGYTSRKLVETKMVPFTGSLTLAA